MDLRRGLRDQRVTLRIGGLALGGLARVLACGAFGAQRQAGALLFMYLFKCQTGTPCDYLQHRMCRVTGHAQCMHFLPGADSNIGWIGGRALLGELALSLAQPLLRVLGQLFGVSADDFRHKRCRDVAVHMIRLPVALVRLFAQIGCEFQARPPLRAGQAAPESMPAAPG